MFEVTIWEDGGELAAQVTALARGAALIRVAKNPAPLAGRRFDLLVAAPQAAAKWNGPPLLCRLALVPGGGAEIAGRLRAEELVSYGMGLSNTLTLSGIREGRAALAVQREFHTLSGKTVERQELVLPYDGPSPEVYLALMGAALALSLDA